jgi:hypothetical protein
MFGVIDSSFLNISHILPIKSKIEFISNSMYLINHYTLGKFLLFRLYRINENGIELIFDSNNFKPELYDEFSMTNNNIVYYFNIYKNLVFFADSDNSKEPVYRAGFRDPFFSPLPQPFYLMIYDLEKKKMLKLPKIDIK